MDLRPAFVRFKNNTCYYVELLWIDKSKTEKSYGILDPKSYKDVNTYASHSWIFRECISKSLMVVCGKKVFMAKPWATERYRLAFSHPIHIPLRTLVIIEVPVLKLRQLCLFQLINILKTKDDVSKLEIPVTLQKELICMISIKEELSNN